MAILNRDDLVPDDIHREKTYRAKRERIAQLKLELDQALWDYPRGDRVTLQTINTLRKEIEEEEQHETKND